MFSCICALFRKIDAGFSLCWTQDTADVFDWTLDANGILSGGTGPSDDVTGGGNSATEASVPRAYGDSAILFWILI